MSNQPVARGSRVTPILLTIVLILQIVTAGAALYVATMIGDIQQRVADMQVTAEELAVDADQTLTQVSEVATDAQERLNALDEALARLQSFVSFFG